MGEQGGDAGGQVAARQPGPQRPTSKVHIDITAGFGAQHRPELHPFNHHLRRVARALADWGGGRAAGVADGLGDRPSQGADVGADVLGLVPVAQRLGVEPQRHKRGAQPVRQVQGPASNDAQNDHSARRDSIRAG